MWSGVVGDGVKLSSIGVVEIAESTGQKIKQVLREPTLEDKRGEIVLNSDDQRQNIRIFVCKMVRRGQIWIALRITIKSLENA